MNMEKGKYIYMRSSEHKAALSYCGGHKYDEESGRWYESLGGSFVGYRDKNIILEEIGREQCQFVEPQLIDGLRESEHEILYDDEEEKTAEVTAVLTIHHKNLKRTFIFTVKHANKKRVEAIVAGIHGWHCSGELRIGAFSCDP